MTGQRLAARLSVFPGPRITPWVTLSGDDVNPPWRLYLGCERQDVVDHQVQVEWEDDMGVSEVMTIFFQLMGGLGLFFSGVGILWFVTVYKEKKE
jgi:hypothetical protein